MKSEQGEKKTMKCEIIRAVGERSASKVNKFLEKHPNIKIIYAKYDGRFFCLYED